MELGKSIDQSGKAAFKPEHTQAHPIAQMFASAVGYDGEGKTCTPDVPQTGLSASSAPDWRADKR